MLVSAGGELAERLATRFDREAYYIDATSIALDLDLEVDGMPMVNLPLFGAVVSQSATAPLGEVLRVVREVAARRGNVEAYEKAASRGFEGIKLAGAKQATVM